MPEDIQISVDGGTSKRLLTAGKYCDRNITVTATGGGGEPEPPDDGKTRLYITIPANVDPDRPPPRNQVPLYIQQSVDRGVTIDWGDGSEPETLPGTGNVNTTHAYERAGDYIISLESSADARMKLGDGTNSVLGGSIEKNFLRSAITNLSSIKGACFKECSCLDTLKVYYDTTMFLSDNICQNCVSLKSVILEGADSFYVGMNSFSGCTCLSFIGPAPFVGIGFPEGFYNCKSITSFFFKEVKSGIDRNFLANCTSLKEIHMAQTDPPRMYATSAFQNLPDDCIIYVPVGSLEAYQTATNWATYADKMREDGA